jgi:hypothetical protein
MGWWEEGGSRKSTKDDLWKYRCQALWLGRYAGVGKMRGKLNGKD